MVDLRNLASQLAEAGKHDNTLGFDVHPIPGDVDVLQILVEDREELPLYISASDEQILCIAYLFKEDEVKLDQLPDMNKAMLQASIAIPLSSFALVDDQYVLYGALSVQSSLEDILHEIQVLSDNVLDAIDAMQHYLQ